MRLAIAFIGSFSSPLCICKSLARRHIRQESVGSKTDTTANGCQHVDILAHVETEGIHSITQIRKGDITFNAKHNLIHLPIETGLPASDKALGTCIKTWRPVAIVGLFAISPPIASVCSNVKASPIIWCRFCRDIGGQGCTAQCDRYYECRSCRHCTKNEFAAFHDYTLPT